MIRFSKHTFLRHYGNMSQIVNQRNDAKFLLQDAEPFLRFITREPQSEEIIVKKIAKLYECSPEDISVDFNDFIQSIRAAVLIGNTPAELDEQEPDFRYYTKIESEQEMAKEASSTIKKQDELDDAVATTTIKQYIADHRILNSLHIDLTISCTERCVHCYIPDYKNRFLSFDTVCKVLNEFRAMGGLQVTFSGGEPMMHPQFCEILRYARKCDLLIYVLSNLTLFSEEIAKTLADVQIKFLQTSVYSMIPEIHEAITCRANSFSETMHGIDLIRRYNIPMKINTPVMKENFNSWQSVKEYCSDQNYKFMSNADLSGRTNHDNRNLDHALQPKEMASYLRECQDCDAWGKILCPDADEPICSILTEHIDLDSQGNYYPCDGCHGLVLGNCHEMSLSEVWNGQKANELRTLKQKDYPQCLNCDDREFCKICPTNNFNETGDILKHIPSRCVLAKLKHKIFEEQSC